MQISEKKYKDEQSYFEDYNAIKKFTHHPCENIKIKKKK